MSEETGILNSIVQRIEFSSNCAWVGDTAKVQSTSWYWNTLYPIQIDGLNCSKYRDLVLEQISWIYSESRSRFVLRRNQVYEHILQFLLKFFTFRSKFKTSSIWRSLYRYTVWTEVLILIQLLIRFKILNIHLEGWKLNILKVWVKKCTDL